MMGPLFLAILASGPGSPAGSRTPPAGAPVVLWSDGVPIRGELLVASWYGPRHHGRRTASGQIFDQEGFTCAHRTLPFGKKLYIRLNRKTVEVTVNDRGPYARGRDLDLSLAAARALGMVGHGVAVVEVLEVRP